MLPLNSEKGLHQPEVLALKLKRGEKVKTGTGKLAVASACMDRKEASVSPVKCCRSCGWWSVTADCCVSAHTTTVTQRERPLHNTHTRKERDVQVFILLCLHEANWTLAESVLHLTSQVSVGGAHCGMIAVK